MTLQTLCEKLGLEKIILDHDTEISGVYVGDFLSRAMSRVEEGNLWLSIMNNINVIAVASLADAAAVILCEDVRLTDDALEAACSKGVTVLYSPLGAYELSLVIGSVSQ